MSYPNTSNQPQRSRWPVVALVIASVSAASLALGLLVVGPMIQHRMSTPPPTLSASAPAVAAVQAAEPERSADEVEIKERPQPRPKPKPVVPPLTIGISPVPDPANVGELSTSTETRPRRKRHQPSIDASITNAGEDGTKAGTKSDGGLLGADGDGSLLQTTPSGDGTESAAKPHKRRGSPLEALPTLGNSLPHARSIGGSGSETPGTAESAHPPHAAGAADEKVPAAPAAEERRGARRYRVQVGRFVSEEDARKLRDELAAAGHSPQVVKSEQNGTVLYRVQVGTFAKKDNAERQVQKLREQSYEPEVADDEP